MKGAAESEVKAKDTERREGVLDEARPPQSPSHDTVPIPEAQDQNGPEWSKIKKSGIPCENYGY